VEEKTSVFPREVCVVPMVTPPLEDAIPEEDTLVEGGMEVTVADPGYKAWAYVKGWPWTP
jgi:hypothetical protein